MLRSSGLILSCVAAVMGVMIASCGRRDAGALPTYTVERTTYEDVLVLDGVVEAVNSMNIYCPADVDGTIVSIVENGTRVKKDDVVCVVEDMNVANKYDQLILDIESAHADLEKLRATQRMEYALLEAQVETNDAEAMLADADSLQMLYMSAVERRIKKLQLERAAIERERLLKKMEATKVMHQADVTSAEKRIERLERQREEERKKMESLTIRAPKEGVVVRAKKRHRGDETWNIGDNIWQGRVVATLPDPRKVKAMLYVPETEYKRMQVGDSVWYAFDAMPDNRAWGRITKMASVGQERTRGSKVKTFEIEASVDSLTTPVEMGLSVNCHVYVSSVPDVLAVPTICIFDKDTLKVVYVQHGRRYEERVVTLGIGSPKMTIVTDGLHEGERVAMIRPKER